MIHVAPCVLHLIAPIRGRFTAKLTSTYSICSFLITIFLLWNFQKEHRRVINIKPYLRPTSKLRSSMKHGNLSNLIMIKLQQKCLQTEIVMQKTFPTD
jgi:hypothetical protein